MTLKERAQALIIAGLVVDALAADKPHGYDLEAGMFGPGMTALLNRLGVLVEKAYASEVASVAVDERRYTQAEMEAFGRAYADARDRRVSIAPIGDSGASDALPVVTAGSEPNRAKFEAMFAQVAKADHRYLRRNAQGGYERLNVANDWEFFKQVWNIAAPEALPEAAPVATWQHNANEWADVATNGIQCLKNVRDGITPVDSAIKYMQSEINRARATAPTSEPIARDVMTPSSPISRTYKPAYIKVKE